MRSPEQVQAKAARRYRSVWRDALIHGQDKASAIPLEPPSIGTIHDHASDVDTWLNTWRTWALEHPATPLRRRTLTTKFGPQSVYTHLEIPDTAALAGLNPTTAEHWSLARNRWTRLAEAGVEDTVRPYLAQIVGLAQADFTTLLAAVAWFQMNPRSGLTVRRVPVPGMHTKWLARHRSVVLACLASPADLNVGEHDTVESDADELNAADLDALGLKASPREISIVIADPALRDLAGGLRQITAPVDELAALPITPLDLLIVENKDPAIAWVDTPGLILVHSLGNHIEALASLPWLAAARCWYWGDLDRHGITLLPCSCPDRAPSAVSSHGRSSCPHLQIPGRARPDHQVRPANADSLQRRTRCTGSPDQ